MEEFWGVEGVLRGRRSFEGLEEFWGCWRSFGGGHGSLVGWSVEFRRVGGVGGSKEFGGWSEEFGGSHGSQGKRREDQSSLTE